MAGIYLHIPFCKQRCSYCDFHFSTNLEQTNPMIKAMAQEIALKKNYLQRPIESIYLGGGTPSLLKTGDLNILFDAIAKNNTLNLKEVTLEANPEDISTSWIKSLQTLPINRISLGVQSFFDEDLRFMNRMHTAKQSTRSVKMLQQAGYKNINLDLIYGLPHQNMERWRHNIEVFLELKIPHLSAYALTVEPRTLLHDQIKKKKIDAPNQSLQHAFFFFLIDALALKNYQAYETSNFAKPGYHALHNTAYWQAKPYLGIGPSAHSFNGHSRGWNVRNNTQYIRALSKNQIPEQQEILSLQNSYNEYIMLGLRTMWGVSLSTIEMRFGKTYLSYFKKQAKKHIEEGQLVSPDGNQWTLAKTQRFFADGIACELFML